MKLLSILCAVTFVVAVAAAESGILQITFQNGSARKDINGDNCDNCFGCTNKCDAYMLVRVDGVEKFRTRSIDGEDAPNFGETFNSGVISKDAKITIEMWDDDYGDSDDDLMSRWANLDVETLLNTYHLGDNYNSIEMYCSWTPSSRRNEIIKERHQRRE